MFDQNFLKSVNNFARGAAGWIDNTFSDIPFVSNPYKKSSGTAGGGGGGSWGPSTPAPKSAPAPSGEDAKWQQMSQQLAALQSQLAAQPRLPSFDILGNYNRAKVRATTDVTPLYEQKLNNFLQGQQVTKVQRTQQRDLSFANSEMSRTQTREDNETNRVRTGQDLANVLQQISQSRGEFLQDEGTQFDDARRGLQEEVAGAGGTDTGMGQQQIDRQLKDRNTSAARQIEEFRNNESAKKLLADRTLEDLATSDVRADEKKTMSDRATQIDFDAAMGQLANEEQSFRLQNDLDKALDIISRTQSYSQQGVAEFIANLAGSGARAQDIALAKQVYM